MTIEDLKKILSSLNAEDNLDIRRSFDKTSVFINVPDDEGSILIRQNGSVFYSIETEIPQSDYQNFYKKLLKKEIDSLRDTIIKNEDEMTNLQDQLNQLNQ